MSANPRLLDALRPAHRRAGRILYLTQPSNPAETVPVAVPATARPHRRRSAALPLLGADLLALAGGFALAATLGHRSAVLVSPAGLGLGALVALILSWSHGLYSADDELADHSTPDELLQLGHVALAFAFCGVFASAVVSHPLSAEQDAGLLAGTFAGLLGARILVRALLNRLPGRRLNTLIVGTGSVGQLLGDKLICGRVKGLHLLGYVDDSPRELAWPLRDLPVLGDIDDLPALISALHVDRVMVAFSLPSPERTQRLLSLLRSSEVQVDVVPRLFDVFGPNAGIQNIDGLPLIVHPRVNRTRLSHLGKRFMDVLISALALALAAPLMALVALLVRLDSPGPVLYRAERIGWRGRPFTQIKFRTMNREHCTGGRYGGARASEALARLLAGSDELRTQYELNHKLNPDPRVTRVGRFLRAASLDELPQLLNVFLGELSLVGPRPVTEPELTRYGAHTEQLLSVRPGLTGYWQVNGRSALTYEERVRLDLAYVRSWSLKLDLKILCKSSHLLTKSSAV